MGQAKRRKENNPDTYGTPQCPGSGKGKRLNKKHRRKLITEAIQKAVYKKTGILVT